ncbi:hypothetical protein BV22DRAFT_1052859, partial [Leucogyrophana mollusca]
MSLQFGDLGQRCEWSDACVSATNRELPEKEWEPTHQTTTLKTFIDLVGDPTTCGNWLDGKNLSPSPPPWVAPLLHCTNAWNQTMHVTLKEGAKGQKSKKPQDPVALQGAPTAIRSATWTSLGWRLVTHPGAVTFAHHDCCGMATYVVGNAGCKIWAVMRPKRELCKDDMKEAFECAIDMSKDGRYSQADVTTVCLEDGDIMFQPPGILHTVYTPVPAIFSGGYFYNYNTMHLTRQVLLMAYLDEEGTHTNDHRPGFFRTLCRMVIAL